MNPLGNGRPSLPRQLNPMTAQVAEAINFARTFSSPEEYLQNLQRNNPQMFQKIMEMQKTVQDPTAYANKVLAERGIDMSQLAGLLQQRK